MHRKGSLIKKHVAFDIISALLAWFVFYFFRKVYVEHSPLEFSNEFYFTCFIIPAYWLILYATAGSYKDVFRKSRLRELGHTLILTLFGTFIIFFVFVLDDLISHKSYYQLFFIYCLLHFCFTFLLRYILVSQTVYKVHNRIIGFNTLLIGSNESAWEIFREMQSQKKSAGNRFVGFVKVDDKNGFSNHLQNEIPCLGTIKNIKENILSKDVEEVIIAIESSEHISLGKIISELNETPVGIKIIPDMYDIMSGQVKMSNVMGTPLIEISREIMPIWKQNIKRVLDISISILVLIIFSPVYLAITIGVKLSSPGHIFYKHERIGLHGNPFMIYKFRSMYADAEKTGPQLSSSNDSRITNFGKFLRRSRLDELPQFYNVLKGEMSIVGPRPERQYFIDQIVLRAPHYKYLLKVRPGITSWGQVKYGYAENVDQMIERLKFDVIYIENMSLTLDFKILLYTVLIVLQGRGK